MAEADHGYIGEPVLRVEDDRLLRGFGRFLDDVPEPPETLHLSFVRSSVAHGLIRSIDTQAAASVPGVVAVVTAADIGNDIKPMRADYDRPGFQPTDWPVIAADRVRYVGEIVAVVLAENPYAAEDAVDLVQVDYESLHAVTTVEEALAPEAPLVHEEIGTNVYFHNAFKTEGFDEVFAAARPSLQRRIPQQPYCRGIARTSRLCSGLRSRRRCAHRLGVDPDAAPAP